MARSILEVTLPKMNLNDRIEFQTELDGKIKDFSVTWIDPHHNQLGTPNDVIHESFQPFKRPNYDALNYAQGIKGLDVLEVLTESVEPGKVIIQSNVDNLIFKNESSMNSGVVFKKTNQNSNIPTLVLNSATISRGSNVCTEVNVTISTSHLVDKITSPFVKDNSVTPVVFSFLRGETFTFTARSTVLNQIVSTVIKTPPRLLEMNLGVSVLGKSVTVNYSSLNGTTGLVLEYSINGVDFSSNNVFDNVADGKYWGYVRDQFGCQVTKQFEVKELVSKSPYYHIPKANSIRYAQREVWDGIKVFKTDENTLSNESNDAISHYEIQRFQTNDVLTTQLRTNYDTVKAFVLSSAGEQPLSVTKPREYLGLKDYRDCVVYQRPNGKAGIYFTSGSKYGYDSGTVIGSYELNGSRPSWYRVGSVIQLDKVGALEIKSVLFDEIKRAEVVEVDYSYKGSPIVTKVKSIYDLRPFNLYEFKLDCSPYENKNLRVKVVLEDPKLPKKEWVSELLEIKKVHAECVEIRYFNDKNDDVFYETGINHVLRIPVANIIDTSISESEIHKGDSQVSLISAEYYEGDTFEFLPLTKELKKKVELATYHSNLIINGVSYKVAEKPESERQGVSNLYTLKAKLIKAGSGYNVNSFVKPDSSYAIDIPSLILGESDGFISY